MNLAALRWLTPLAILAALHGETIPLSSPARLELRHATALSTIYRGKPALRLTEKGEHRAESPLAIIRNSTFRNGVIEVDLAGAPSANAGPGARGFIGIAFRVQGDGGAKYENFYIRPTNGRADDQLRRNHATQYESVPDWPWDRLRKESPGVYESYADMAAGEWTHLRIVVHGVEASLYVGASATQPCLIVHDLKLGDGEGAVALWIGPGTEGYFANLAISH